MSVITMLPYHLRQEFRLFVVRKARKCLHCCRTQCALITIGQRYPLIPSLLCQYQFLSCYDTIEDLVLYAWVSQGERLLIMAFYVLNRSILWKFNYVLSF